MTGPAAKAWLLAARPRTLPAAAVPVLLGTAAAAATGRWDPVAAGLCLAFALLLQIGANLANDADDFDTGADHAGRLGPTRAVAAGLIPVTAMRRAAYGTLGLAFVVGLGLLPAGGWPLLLVGVACVLGAQAYTGAPLRLGYRGWGEVMVFVYFGLVAVCGTYYVQALRLDPVAWVFSGVAGALSTNLLVVNNHRDRETDAGAGKRTLAVRFGGRFALMEYAFGHLLAYVLVGAGAGLLGHVGPLLGLVTVPWSWSLTRELTRATDRASYGRVLAGTARHLAVTGVLVALGMVVGAV